MFRKLFQIRSSRGHKAAGRKTLSTKCQLGVEPLDARKMLAAIAIGPSGPITAEFLLAEGLTPNPDVFPSPTPAPKPAAPAPKPAAKPLIPAPLPGVNPLVLEYPEGFIPIGTYR